MRLSLVVLLCFTIVLVNSATTRRRLIVTSGRNTTKAPAPKSAYAYLRTVRGKKSCSGGTCPFWERHGRSFAALRCYSQQYQECTCLHRMCFSSCMFSREVCNQEMVSCLRQICPRCMPPSASAMCAVYDSMATRVAEALSVFACYPCCAIFHAAPTNTTNTASSTTTPAITESSTTVPFEETYGMSRKTFGPSNTENPEDDYYTGIINQLSTNAVPFNNQNAGSYPTNNVNNGVYTNSNGNIYPNTNVNGNTNINSFPNTNVNTNSNINGNGVPNTNTNTFINANGNGVPNTNTNTFPNNNNNGYANGNTNVNAPINTNANGNGVPNTNANGNGVPNTNANGNGVPNTNANGNGVPNTNANGNGVSNTNVNTLPNTNANANPNANTNTNSNGNGNAGANVNSATTGNGINNVNNGNGNGYSGNCNGVNNYPGVVFPGSDAMFYNNNFPLRNQQAVKQRGRQTAMPGKRRSTTRRTLVTTRRPAQANRIVRGSTVKSSVRKPVQAVKKPQTNNRVKS